MILNVKKPSVLILGVLDHISANVIRYLVGTGQIGYIRVATFNPLSLCQFSKECTDALDKVECIQANLNKNDSLDMIFRHNTNGKSWDFIFFIGESRLGQTDQVYYQRISEPAQAIARKAAETGAGLLVYLTSGLFYEKNSSSKPNREESSMKATLPQYKAYQLMEKAMQNTKGIRTIGLRSAIIYGPEMYGKMFIPIAVARVHCKIGEPVQSLLASDAPYHCVHISDLARAFWHVAQWSTRVNSTFQNLVFNLAQPVGNDPRHMSEIIYTIFGVKTIFRSTLMNKAVSVALTMLSMQDEINEGLLGPWTQLLAESNIHSTPISPYIEKEMLTGNKYAIDGRRITDVTGFCYKHPEITIDEIRGAIRQAQHMNFWPQADQI
ncbi:hypothetical protein BDF19DRAFT_226084 [Syncephalis fuscata]|nr:hypothetical protein BDF19DRAFT_226084 [Syncephalis fuscata]